MALDFDDYGFAGHTGHSAVLAALAAAEGEGATVGAMTAAQIASNEISGRLGASVILGPHNGQMWSHIHLAGGKTVFQEFPKGAPGRPSDETERLVFEKLASETNGARRITEVLTNPGAMAKELSTLLAAR